MVHEHHKRRVFITDGSENYQIFDFIQNKNEGSIYVSSPNFSEIKLLAISTDQGKPQISIIDSPGDGKLSLHASGMVSIRNYTDIKSRKLVVFGNYLLNLEKNVAGVRHLFTIYIAQPKHTPASPALNRKSDYLINSSKELSPLAIIFFAVPRILNLTVGIQAGFNIDDLDSIPPDGGMGIIELPYHSIMWFAYKTKYMNKWPKHPIVCYYDGYTVPTFIGTGEGEFRMELYNPTYKLTENELTINLAFGEVAGTGNIA